MATHGTWELAIEPASELPAWRMSNHILRTEYIILSMVELTLASSLLLSRHVRMHSRVGNRTSDAHYNRTPLLGICVRHLSDNATGLKNRYHSRWVSIFIGVPPSLSFLYIVR